MLPSIVALVAGSVSDIDDVNRAFVAENPFAKRNYIAQGIYMLDERELIDLLGKPLHGAAASPAGDDAATAIRDSQSKIYDHGPTLRTDLHLDDDRNRTTGRHDGRIGLKIGEEARHDVVSLRRRGPL